MSQNDPKCTSREIRIEKSKVKEACSCVHHEGKWESRGTTALILKVGRERSEFSASRIFRFIAGDKTPFAPRIREWMAPNTGLNVVSIVMHDLCNIVTRLGAGLSRHRDSIIGSGTRFCSFGPKTFR